MKTYLKLIILFLFISGSSAIAQKSLLQSGPMIGRVNKTDIKLWAQTKKPAHVKFAYWLKGKPASKKYSEAVKTNKENAYTAHIIIDHLKPGKEYTYQLYINNKKVSLGFPTSFKTQEVWKYHHAPSDFAFAFGSGAYINDPEFDRKGRAYGGEYEIFTHIPEKNPAFMVWDGDNTYLRQNEWDSKSAMVYRYTHDWSIPEKQKLFATMAHYAIVDDHDFGPNDSDGSFWNKDTSIGVFDLFFANPKHVSGFKSATFQFNYNDADFFLVDNRYFRDPNSLKSKDPKTMLGKKQLDWLKKALVFSKAKWKFVVMGGQFLNTARNFETYSNNGFDKERQDIIDFIYKENLKNVIFLTGDRHLSEISLLDQGPRYPKIWDVTVSPLTSGPNTHGNEEKNLLRIPGTLIMKRNFAIFRIEGKGKDRHIRIEFFDKQGKKINEFTINQDEYNSSNGRKRH